MILSILLYRPFRFLWHRHFQLVCRHLPIHYQFSLRWHLQFSLRWHLHFSLPLSREQLHRSHRLSRPPCRLRRFLWNNKWKTVTTMVAWGSWVASFRWNYRWEVSNNYTAIRYKRHNCNDAFNSDIFIRNRKNTEQRDEFWRVAVQVENLEQDQEYVGKWKWKWYEKLYITDCMSSTLTLSGN